MIRYDKLKNMKTDEKTFEFICPRCKCDGFKKGNWNIVPIGVPYKPDFIDNKDIGNPLVKKHCDSLFTKRKAILDIVIEPTENKRLLFECKKCREIINPYNERVLTADIRKWCNHNLGEDYFVL